MSGICINAYEIEGIAGMAWPVRRYAVRRRDGVDLRQEDRGRMKNAAFGLRRDYRAQCSGYGFIIDVDERTLVVPKSWVFPSGVERDGLIFDLTDEFDVRSIEPGHDVIVAAILREALKRHLKDRRSQHFGGLWQDFARFCQMPRLGSHDRVAHCRGFEALAKRMTGQRWVFTIAVSTTAVDGRSIADYLSRGEAAELAELIHMKQSSHVRRDDSPGAVRAFVHGAVGAQEGRIVELDEPDVLAAYDSLSAADQRQLVGTPIRCHAFMREPELLPPGSLYLVLDTHQTEELHSDTILEPAERFDFTSDVRQHLSGADLFGAHLTLSEQPFDCSDSAVLVIPPAIRIKGPRGIDILRCAEPVTEAALHNRARERKDRIVKNGFLVSRPMRPLLAVPERMNESRARNICRPNARTFFKTTVSGMSPSIACPTETPPPFANTSINTATILFSLCCQTLATALRIPMIPTIELSAPSRFRLNACRRAVSFLPLGRIVRRTSSYARIPDWPGPCETVST